MQALARRREIRSLLQMVELQDFGQSDRLCICAELL
jgi:hypothetical protein